MQDQMDEDTGTFNAGLSVTNLGIYGYSVNHTNNLPEGFTIFYIKTTAFSIAEWGKTGC